MEGRKVEMNVKMSEHFGAAVKEAALQLSEENRKVYLRSPFSGFCVTFDPPEEFVDSFESEGRTVFVICESFLGKPA
jgi:hypothetical protein